MSCISGISHFSRRQILAGLLGTAASGALAGAPERSIWPQHRTRKVALQAAGDVGALIKKAGLSGKMGFVVANAETGEILETHNPLLSLPPASVTKAVTTLYGLDALGGAYRFQTRIMVTGPIEKGRVQGDLYLLGGGDPTLDSDALGELARRVKDAGIREISGKTYVHSGALPYQKSIDPSQPDYLGYNPSLSGLNLNYNRVFFEWKRGANGFSITMDARALKYRPRVEMASMKVVDRKAPVFTIKSTAGQDQWTVAKRALGKKGGRWLPVRRPEIYAAEVFHTIARSFGIQLPTFVATKAMPEGQVVAHWQSESLTTIARGMLKYSNNLIAEAMGVSASRKRGGTANSLTASGRMMSDWVKASCNTRHAKFVDHSGLGDKSRISANDMVRVLQKSGWNGPLRSLMKEIAFRDVKGKPIKNHPVKVRAKTGTLNFVSALAGYVETRKGQKLMFAIFTADMATRGKIPKSQRDRPKGAKAWNKRSKVLQQKLIERWAKTFNA